MARITLATAEHCPTSFPSERSGAKKTFSHTTLTSLSKTSGTRQPPTERSTWSTWSNGTTSPLSTSLATRLHAVLPRRQVAHQASVAGSRSFSLARASDDGGKQKKRNGLHHTENTMEAGQPSARRATRWKTMTAMYTSFFAKTIVSNVEKMEEIDHVCFAIFPQSPVSRNNFRHPCSNPCWASTLAPWGSRHNK